MLNTGSGLQSPNPDGLDMQHQDSGGLIATGHESEQGSVVIALMVLMIIALLGAAALTRSQSSLHAVQQNVDRATAGSGAERGLAEAISRLEHGESPPFSGTGLLHDGTFSYEVTNLNSTVVEIYAEAETNGARRAIEATVNGTINRGYTVFATERIVSDDNQGTITGRVGTNGEFRVFGDAPGDEQEIFSPNGECLNCPNLIESAGPMSFPEPEFPTGPTEPCSVVKAFFGTVDGHNGTPYVCDGAGSVVFYRNQRIINPPLIIYAGPERKVVLFASAINQGGRASDFQLFVQSDPDNPVELILAPADIAARIYAPGRHVQPFFFTLTGSMVVGELQINDGWVLNVSHDDEIASQGTSSWQITSWQEVPAR